VTALGLEEDLMQVERKMLRAAAAGAAILVLAGLAAACGNSQGEDPTPVSTFLITPGASRTPGTAVASPSAPAQTPAATPGTQTAGNALTVVAKNIQFDKSELEATAGAVTITLDNQDSGVPHNIHVFKGDSPSGASVGATSINPGPDKSTLNLTLEAGEYYYHCDVHPNMKGSLTVS
jgi:plastocyanin